MHPSGPPGLSLGENWTPLTRNVLVGLFLVYVAQLLVEARAPGAVEGLFAWWPLVGGGTPVEAALASPFRPWQPLTAFLLGGAPIWTLFSWVFLFFLIAPLDSMLGRRGFIRATLACWATGVVVSLLLSFFGVVDHAGPFSGLAPLLAALIALFGFLRPNLTFLIMFVIPMRAGIVAWGTGLLAFLYLLARHDLGSSLAFFCWGGAWAWTHLDGHNVRRAWLKWKRQRIERKLRRFEVIEGGRGKERRKSGTDDWVN